MWSRRSPSARDPTFDEEAVQLLPAIFDTALRLCGTEAEGHDLTHDTFVRAFAAADRYERGSSLRAWLFSILYNLFRNRLRDRARHAEVELDEQELPPVASAEPQPQWKAITSDELDRAIEGLPLKLREVIVLRDLQGLSYREISQVLDVPAGTVMSRLHRGRLALKGLLLPKAWSVAPGDDERDVK
jgi:RNA polymerase sigma-70 factor, ECF subfamily